MPIAAIAIIVMALTACSSSRGEKLFVEEGCIHCHLFKGKGGGTGPDLTNVTRRRDYPWIRNQIRNPEEHNPRTEMPSYSHLSEEDVRALFRYLKG
ncbi:MAG: cytochrome c [Nitrospirota bacterium]